MLISWPASLAFVCDVLAIKTTGALWFRICGNYRQSLRVSPSGALRFLILTPIKKLLAAIPAQYCHQGPYNKVLSDRGGIGRQPRCAVSLHAARNGDECKAVGSHARRLCHVSILLSHDPRKFFPSICTGSA